MAKDLYSQGARPGGFLSGGCGDELAVQAGIFGRDHGFWAERGATIIQTDEPKAAIGWLGANGFRVPYVDEAKPAEPRIRRVSIRNRTSAPSPHPALRADLPIEGR
ncbi:hypothetical protein X731_07715 [Mesorhizobium sp. L2C054A000]|nr:hypothetical protein X731_07715 [Mesorhizobium sp. L2C054A000]